MRRERNSPERPNSRYRFAVPRFGNPSWLEGIEESEAYFYSLNRLCEWISPEEDSDSEVDEEEAANDEEETT